MIRNFSFKRPIAMLVITAVSGLGLAACADPSSDSSSSSGSGKSSAPKAGEKFGGKEVASVNKLVPAEFKSRVIKNAIYNDFPPEEFVQDGKLAGIQPDIAQAVSEVMGVKMQNLSVGSFDSLIPGTVSGRYDMSSADFGVTADRLKQVDFVSEFKIGTAFAVKKGSSITVTKATDLCGHSVGVQSGSYFIDQIKGADKDCKSAGLDPIQLKTFPDDGARTLAVTNGRIEITATTEDALGYTISSQNVPLELQKFVYEPLEQAIVFPKGSKLAPAVQAAMKEIVSNGTYAKILKKWGVQTIGYSKPEQVLYLTNPSQTP